jgi:pimeloyl-ACP methyl ester carboxylesterase
MLAGTWGHQDEETIHYLTLNADNSVSNTMTWKDNFKKMFHQDVRSCGTWKVQDGVVLVKIDSSSDMVLGNFINAVFWGMGYALKNDMDAGVMESNWLTPIPRLLILVGHSITGVALTYFTEKHPDRVSKLVYLDAVYYDVRGQREVLKNSPARAIQPPIEKNEFDSVEEYIEYIKYLDPGLVQIWNQMLDETAIYDLEINSEGKFVEVDTSSIMRQLLEDATRYNPERVNISAPVLCFEAISVPIRPAYFTEEQKQAANDFNQNQWMPFKQQRTLRFRQDVPQAKLIEIQGANHACHISHEEIVYEEMRKFLSGV